MKYIKGISDFCPDGDSVVTIGKFDGIHRGHRRLIDRVVEISRMTALRSVLFTFDIPPRTVINKCQSILSYTEREEMLSGLPLDVVIECPFDGNIMEMEAGAFVQDILFGQLRARKIVTGCDFRFGHARGGDVHLLKELALKYGVSVEIFQKEKHKGFDISSTYIRKELQKGNIEKANELLGYDFFIQGEVIHGKALGRRIGIPTINILPDDNKLLPPHGVYFSEILVCGNKYNGVTNIGIKPTVGGHKRGVETHLFDCDKDLYGVTARVSLKHFSREEIMFEDVEDLRVHIAGDISDARKYFMRST